MRRGLFQIAVLYKLGVKIYEPGSHELVERHCGDTAFEPGAARNGGGVVPVTVFNEMFDNAMMRPEQSPCNEHGAVQMCGLLSF